MQILKQNKRMAEQDSSMASLNYKEQPDKASLKQNLTVEDKVLTGNQLCLPKNKKLFPIWIGPFTISKIIN